MEYSVHQLTFNTMKLEPIATGCWSFQAEESAAGTSIKIILHARDADGNPCLNPSSELIAAAKATECNAPQLRDGFIRQIECPDPDEVLANRHLPVTGFTHEELLNPSDDVIQRLQSRLRLLHISVEQFPHGSIETCGYVVDAWSRVWQVGDDYVEGCFELDEFPT